MNDDEKNRIEIAINNFKKYNLNFCLDAIKASNNGNHIMINKYKLILNTRK